MTQAEKLEALVRRAIESGWDMFAHSSPDKPLPWFIVSAGQMPTPKVVEDWVPDNTLLICGWDDHYYVWEKVVFDTNFARALFGEEEDGTEIVAGVYGEQPKRRANYHLQQAVISKDPIGYMYKAVFGNK